jgi:hypothetical protein
MTEVINHEAARDIRSDIQYFVAGHPTVSEIEIAPGIYWFFDCPFDEDVYEPFIPVSVMFTTQSDDYGEPTDHSSLADYADGLGDTLMAELEGTVRNAGVPLNELRLEYNPNNSDPEAGFYQFLGSIPNAIQT